jgi:hypothetical protein
MPTNNLAPKAKNKLGYASSIPPNMAEQFGAAVSPYLQSVQGLFPPTNPYGQAVSNFLLGQAPQAAQQMAAGYPNVLFNTSNPLGGNRLVNPAALDMLGALPVATALKGAGLAKGGVAATFAGARAKTANHAALALAEKMKAEGVADEEIHKATGWFFGSADGKPRFEIDDSGARFPSTPQVDALYDKLKFNKDGLVTRGPYKKVESAQNEAIENLSGESLGSVMRHPQAFEAYPSSRNILTEFNPSIRGASYNPNAGFGAELVTLGQDSNKGFSTAKSTTLHEIQHAIQQREGFARGGSPEYLASTPSYWPPFTPSNDVLTAAEKLSELQKVYGLSPAEAAAKWRPAFKIDDDLMNQAVDMVDSGQLPKWQAELNKYRVGPHEAYRRLAGESEARLTQARMDMTGPERAASYPPNMYDVPVSDQIVRYGEGPALATTSNVEADFSGTKILDAEGKPLVVYHGTNDVFDTFNPKLTRDIGSHFGTESQAHKFGKNIMPVNLNIRNPLPMDDVFSRQDGLGDAWRTINDETNVTPAERDKLLEYKRAVENKWNDDRDFDNTKIKEFKQFWKLAEKVIRRSGFDGIVYRNKVEGDFDSYVAFDPKQIKSAGPSFKKAVDPNNPKDVMLAEQEAYHQKWRAEAEAKRLQKLQATTPESQAIARYREVKGPKSVVRMEAALRTAGVPLPKNEPVAYIQRLVDQAHRRN